MSEHTVKVTFSGHSRPLAASIARVDAALADLMAAGPRPWLHPDRNPFPLLDRLTAAATETYDRITSAWYTLRHGDHDRW